MKLPVILFILLITAQTILQGKENDRAELLQLLNERKELFDKYNASLNNKSGLFGNKTKNDLRDSQDKLMAVVAADNKIMNSLSRTLDFRNFEKQTMSYDVSNYEDRIRNLSVLNDTLNKQYINCKNENKNLYSTVKRYHLYIAALVILILITGGAWAKKTFF